MGVRSLRAAWTGGSDVEGGSQAVRLLSLWARLLSLWARLLKCPHDVVASPAQTKWSEREQGGSCILSWPGPGNHIPSLLPPVHIQRQGGWGAVRLHLLKEDTSKNSPKYFKTMTVLFHTPFFFSFVFSYLVLLLFCSPPPTFPPRLPGSRVSARAGCVCVCVMGCWISSQKSLPVLCSKNLLNKKWVRERKGLGKENTLLDLWKR